MQVPRLKSILTIMTTLAVFAACSEEMSTEPVLPPVRSAQQITCQADVHAGRLQCGDPAPAATEGGPLYSVVLGGQGTYVQLTSSNVSYDGGTEIFQADVTVQSRLGQSMGTPDGSTITGIRLFLHTGPTVTSGTGTVTVANPAGIGTFTGSSQPYFEYNEILGWYAMSAPQTWQWHVPPTVDTFEFTVLLDIELPAEQGVLRWRLQVPSMEIVDVWGADGEVYAAVGMAGYNSTRLVLHFDGTAWRAQPTPLPLSGASVLSVWGSSLNDIFMVGHYGTIIHYDGTTWSQQASLTSNDLHGVWTSSPTDAFAVGTSGTILHHDGSGWTPQTSGSTYWLRGVWGSSATDVFAVGDNGTILHYDGTTWASHTSGTTGRFYAVWGTSSANVYAVGIGGVYHYDGANWTQQQSGFALRAIWGTSASDVYAAGDGDPVSIFHNDGTGWTQQTTGLTGTYQISSGWSFSENDVYVFGLDGFVAGRYQSSVIHYDGIEWSVSHGNDLNDIWGSSADDMFGVGDGGVVVHFDGSRWERQTTGTTMNFLGVWGSSASDVFAVGSGGGGALYHYNGMNWSAQNSGTFEPLNGVWGSSASDMFAVGDNGTIVHYDGSSWTPQVSGTTVPLFCVWGSSATDVYAGGNLGTILHFDGSSWSTQVSGGFYAFMGIWGSSASDVFAVGGQGAVAHYDGTSWSGMPIAALNNAYFYAVWGTSSSDVFATGSGNFLAHYNGSVWTAHLAELGIGAGRSEAIWASSPTNVYIASTDGILRGTR